MTKYIIRNNEVVYQGSEMKPNLTHVVKFGSTNAKVFTSKRYAQSTLDNLATWHGQEYKGLEIIKL